MRDRSSWILARERLRFARDFPSVSPPPRAVSVPCGLGRWLGRRREAAHAPDPGAPVSPPDPPAPAIRGQTRRGHSTTAEFQRQHMESLMDSNERRASGDARDIRHARARVRARAACST